MTAEDGRLRQDEDASSEDARSMEDVRFMKMALALAEKGRGRTSPNPMVGAVVVKDGEVVGRGWHQKAGGPHAEVHAIDDAGERARGATLYVTLEPCNHTGRTPPCSEKILAAGIRRVVTAMDDPNPKVTGGGNGRLRAAGVAVTAGVCEAEARRQNEIFVKHITTGRPFVVVKCAATLDGRIATRTGDSKWVTGPEAREYVHALRSELDAILVGIGTVRADDPSLTARLSSGGGKDPIRVVLDTHLTLSPDRKMFHAGSTAPTLIATGPAPPADRPEALNKYKRREALEKASGRAVLEKAGGREALEKAGGRIIEAPLADGRVDLAALMDILGGMDIASLLVEGGAAVIGAFIRAGLADRLDLFFAPKLLGGEGIPICSGPGPARMAEAIGLSDVSIHRFGPDMMIRGYPIKNCENFG